MRGQRSLTGFVPTARDLLIGALIAAALIGAPAQTVEKRLLAGMSDLSSRSATAPAKQCREHVSCDTGAPHR
jgi:hypothetical protein